MTSPITDIKAGLADGRLVPYLGPAVLELMPECPVPATEEALAAVLTAKVAVPHKIKKKLTAASQFIENFKHRKTLVNLMNGAFKASVTPSPLHSYLASLPKLPLIVHAWYDDGVHAALSATGRPFAQVQGLSQSEHFGQWVGYYDAAGAVCDEASAAATPTLLYQPLGSIKPADNYIISDSDYVEVLTEIDIQTPIPEPVKAMRTDRGFVFIGCRFSDQLSRSYARQVMKRSVGPHYAILDGDLTRNEQRFLEEQNIIRVPLSIEAFQAELTGVLAELATE